jgi:hypothetical protein
MNTHTKGPMAAIIVIVALLIIGGAYFYFNRAPGDIAPQDIAWGFDSVPVEDGQHPITKVTLRVKDKEYDAGSYDGTCARITEPTQLLEGEIAGVLCWFAGTGDEVGVFEEDNKFVVKHGEVEEPNEESQGFRGNFAPLFTL